MRLGISNLDNLNPLISKNQNIQDISKLIYEPLFNIKNDFSLESALGEEFSKAESKVYFVKLRKDAKWHNESNFTAEDVKYTIEAIKKLGESSIYITNVSNIEKVEVINENLVKIYLYEEVQFFEYNLTFPIISSKLYGDEDILLSDKNNVPMGTGKYKLKSIDINSQINLTENENWWNREEKELRIDTVTIRIYGSISELYNAYKLGRNRYDNNSELKYRR